MTAHETPCRPEVTGLIDLLGADITRFEATVFHLASQLTVDDPDQEITRYQGGNWRLPVLSTMHLRQHTIQRNCNPVPRRTPGYYGDLSRGIFPVSTQRS